MGTSNIGREVLHNLTQKMKLQARSILLLALLLPLAACVLLRLQSPAFAGDDALMTFRVAKNFLAGKGFVCNPGDYVLSTSSTLWALTIAFASRVSGLEPAQVYFPLSVFLDTLNIVLLFWLASAKGERPWLGSTAAMFFALSWHAAYSTMIGMESPLVCFLFLTAATVLNHVSTLRFRFALGLLAGVTFIARPEGMLFIAALLLTQLIRLRRLPLAEGWGAVLVVVSYWSWMLYYFGSIIPVAAMAKKLAYYRQPLQALKSLVGHVVFFFFTPTYEPTQTWTSGGVSLLFLVICLLGMVTARKHLPGLLLLGIFSVAFWALYVFSNPHLFEWYVVPLEPFYCTAFVWGSAWICKRLKLRREIPAAVIFGLLLLAALRYDPILKLRTGLGSSGYGKWPGLVNVEKTGRLTALAPDERESIYRELALQLKDELTPQKTVLAPEFGTFGYYSEAKMVSSIGHVNPEVFPYLPAPRAEIGKHINNGISATMVKGLRPDYILSLETFVRIMLKDEWVQKNYETLAFRPSQVFGSHGLFLLRKTAELKRR